MVGGSGVDITALFANAAQVKTGGRSASYCLSSSKRSEFTGLPARQASAASKRAVWERKSPRLSNAVRTGTWGIDLMFNAILNIARENLKPTVTQACEALNNLMDSILRE